MVNLVNSKSIERWRRKITGLKIILLSMMAGLPGFILTDKRVMGKPITLYYFKITGGIDMKKLCTITILVLLFTLMFSAVTFADSIVEEVEKTNSRIEQLINKAIDKANDNALKYLKEIDKKEKKIRNTNRHNKQMEVINKKYELKLEKLGLNKYYYDKNEEDFKRIQKQIKKVYEKFKKRLNKKQAAIFEYQYKRTHELNEIIFKLIEDTNEEAQELKDEAAEEGVTVICELIEVEIDGQKAWIDPLRIVGY